MQEQKFNAKEKKVSRMSRDGLVEENLATKESRKLTDRESEVSFKSRMQNSLFVSGNDASGKNRRNRKTEVLRKKRRAKARKMGIRSIAITIRAAGAVDIPMNQRWRYGRGKQSTGADIITRDR